jgi:glutamine amidotransferase
MITIVDYGNPNTDEVAEFLKQITSDYNISNSEVDICLADKIIFPGTGDSKTAIRQLHLLNLFTVLRIVDKPMLGIGLGMQLMADYSIDGNLSCLGIFPGSTIKFGKNGAESVNEGMQPVHVKTDSVLFKEINNDEKFYFKHSYYIPPNELTTSTSLHDENFTSSMEDKNHYGVQFHPEKSGEVGLVLLKNFINL